MHSQSEPYIKATKDTKTYRRPSKTEEIHVVVDNPQQSLVQPAPYPEPGNETIIEGKHLKVNFQKSRILNSKAFFRRNYYH